jgi:tetratricopeptide (TPR) repeat protein
MVLTLLAPLVLVQAAALAPSTLEDAQLRACMIEARSDPAAAITTASQWLQGLSGAPTSAPQQCLGFAYMGLLRWDAAAAAFIAARDARLIDDKAARARLGAMAGNAALAGGRNEAALALLQQAGGDAAAVGDGALGGSIATDRARAFVGLGRPLDGAQALASARELSPQDPTIWLLSATLARRMEDLESARGWIAIAAALDPANAAVGLEAGVIAALGGSDDAARASFQSVIDLAPRSAEADTARTYLAQLSAVEEPAE